MILSGGFELCEGEVNDFILELVQNCLNNIPPDVHNRRRELCEEILKYNYPTGKRAQAKERLTNVLKTWCARQDQINQLENMGFTVTKGRTHYKVRWRNSSYFAAIPATPSDRRGGANAVSTSVAAFF
jgi:hypothetical protein